MVQDKEEQSKERGYEEAEEMHRNKGEKSKKKISTKLEGCELSSVTEI